MDPTFVLLASESGDAHAADFAGAWAHIRQRHDTKHACTVLYTPRGACVYEDSLPGQRRTACPPACPDLHPWVGLLGQKVESPCLENLLNKIRITGPFLLRFKQVLCLHHLAAESASSAKLSNNSAFESTRPITVLAIVSHPINSHIGFSLG